MASRNDCWGIEIGSYAIKAMHLVRSGSDVRLADYVQLPYKQVLSTPDLDIDEQIRLQLTAFLAQHDVSKSTIVASVPGNMAFARFAKLPPVEPKQVKKIVEFEAKQQIPFPIDQVEWDHQVFQQDDMPDVEVGIFAITKERVMSFLANFRAVNVRVDEITLAPVAAYNAFIFDQAEQPAAGTVYLDIGTTATDVIIVENESIWLRTLPIGGNNFTEALVRSFKLSYPKAEKLKLEASTSKYARQIFQAMRPVFADLVQEIQRSLGYYQSIHRDSQITRLVGLGSTFRLPGLTKFLKQQMQLDVQRPDAYSRISVDGKREADFAEDALNLATVYGLALQGLGEHHVHANLMPTPILRQRVWSAKQPWFAAAAVLMAASAALPVYRYYADAAAIEQVASDLEPQVQAVTRKADGFKREFEEVKSGGRPIEEIRGLQGLAQMRTVWPTIFADVSQAIRSTNPQPELLSGDIAEIKKIPRPERRQISVESFVTTYIPQPQDDEDRPQNNQPSFDKGGGMFGGPMGGPGGPGGPGGMMGGGFNGGGMMGGARPNSGSGDFSGSYQLSDFFTEKSGPRFHVVLTGTTPNQQGADFLTNTLIKYLKDHADQPDRPYKFVFPETVLVSIERIQSDATNTGRSTRGNAGGMMGGAPKGMEMGGMGNPMGMGGMTRSRTTSTNADELLPPNPLADEPRTSDIRFRIEWFIELKSPEQSKAASGELALR